ncbi:Cadherin-like and PC-esterase domain-containing protein [Schistosoma japonicum]|nr:Cadherin-like and PC-esterase domain-containing protein [Schistosoma japonicum]KAH8877730.1 Cadherin-like and PC-esterase domain-containing protein [Schistosoma japonicum]
MKFGLEHMILLNITVSESTLYIRARLRIEQGGCTQQTIYTKWINYSVGLGVNKLRYRIDSLYKKVHQTIATGVNSVRFNVVRLLPEIVVNKSELKVCIMEQNCLHWIDRSRPCGLQEVRSIFKPKDYPLIDEWNKSGGWLAFQAYIQDLCSKNCSPHQCMNNKELQITHSAWFIPCSSCNKVKHQVNCDWSIALWYEPNNRLYPCLYNKQMIQNDQQLLTTYLKDRVFHSSTQSVVMHIC